MTHADLRHKVIDIMEDSNAKVSVDVEDEYILVADAVIAAVRDATLDEVLEVIDEPININGLTDSGTTNEHIDWWCEGSRATSDELRQALQALKAGDGKGNM